MITAYAAKCREEWVAPMLNSSDPYFGIDEVGADSLYSAWTEEEKSTWLEGLKKTLPKRSRIQMRMRFLDDLYGMKSGSPIFLGKGKQGEFWCVAVMVVNGDPRYDAQANLPHQRPVTIVWTGEPVRVTDLDWVNNRLQPLDRYDRVTTAFEWYIHLTMKGDGLMKGRYGLTAQQWEEAKVEIRDILVACAKERQMIPYSRLTARMNSVKLTPDSTILHHLLGEISTDEDAAGRGMLSVLVVHKLGDMKPGRGFFELADGLGRDVEDIDRCWIDEVLKVFSYWEQNRSVAGTSTAC